MSKNFNLNFFDFFQKKHFQSWRDAVNLNSVQVLWNILFSSKDVHRNLLNLDDWNMSSSSLKTKQELSKSRLKDFHRRQKLMTDFFQTFWINYFGCDHLNFEKKNIYLPWFPGGSFFKGLDNKIIGFLHIQWILTTDFLQFETHIVLDTRFEFTK